MLLLYMCIAALVGRITCKDIKPPALPPPPNLDSTQPSADNPPESGTESEPISQTRDNVELPRLSSDRERDVTDSLPVSPIPDDEPDPIAIPDPISIPLPNLQPAPRPPIQLPPINVLPPNYFCSQKFPFPLPTPSDCPSCEGQCDSTTCIESDCGVQRYCSCDTLCLYFNDCCDNFQTFCPSQFEVGRDILNRKRTPPSTAYDCKSTFKFRPRGRSIAVSRTPMIQKCSDGTACPDGGQMNLQSDLNFAIPVTDGDTGLTYVNFLCASCNQVSSMKPWPTQVNVMKSVKITPADSGGSTFTALRYQQDLDYVLQNPQVYAEPRLLAQPPLGTNLRQCLDSHNLISTCSDSCNENPELVELCANSTQILSANMFYHFTGIFKNYYCALCAWSDLNNENPGFNYVSTTQCGDIANFFAMALVSGDTTLDIYYDFDTIKGITLEYRKPSFCQEVPTKPIPEPRNCPTCRNKCGSVSQLSGADLNAKQFCSCDALCYFYNDCCERFSTYCPLEWEAGIKKLSRSVVPPINVVECFPTRIMEDITSKSVQRFNTFMVASCNQILYPNTSCTDIPLLEQLAPREMFRLRPNVNEYIPVTDSVTGIHYASRQCAKCNHANNVIFWTAIANFGQNNASIAVKNFSAETAFNLDTDLSIVQNASIYPGVAFIPPRNVTLRQCYHSSRPAFTKIIDKCPDTCLNKEIKDLCENGRYLYTSINGYGLNINTYKNYHCAMCSWDEEFMRNFGMNASDFMACGAEGYGSDSQEFWAKISLTLVFDLDATKGSQIEQSGGNNHTDDKNLNVLGMITVICITISIICLLVRVILQYYVSHYWTLAGKMQLQLACALLVSFLFLLLGAFSEGNHPLCYFCSVVKNFGFLAAFSWMNSIAYITWKTFGGNLVKHHSKRSKGGTLIKISIITWLLPTILTLMTVFMDLIEFDNSSFNPSFADGLCWYGQRYALLIYFGTPVALSTLLNIILFTMTTIHLRRAFINSNEVSKQDKQNFQIYIRLFTLMGITWILGFIVPFVDNIILKSLFIVLNALQGLFMFIAFVCQRKVLESLLHGMKPKSSQSSSSSNNSDQSSGKQKTDIKRLSIDELTHLKVTKDPIN